MTPYRICIVASDVLAKNTENEMLLLAQKLVQKGHSVTFFYLQQHKTDGSKINALNNHCKNFPLLFLTTVLTNHVIADVSIQLSYEAFIWLSQRQHDYDCIYFPLSHGIGYYSILAKHQGLYFQQINFIINVSAPLFMERVQEHEYINDLREIVINFMERQSLSLADNIINMDDVTSQWMAQHRWKLPEKKPVKTVLANNDNAKVSVCIIHFNRPAFLAKTLESVRLQDYKNMEVILVDDGSTDTDAKLYIESLIMEFEQKKWRIIQQENASANVARNTAVKHATGDYLLFLDDDNYLETSAVSTFMRAAICANADILTSVFRLFNEDSDLHAPHNKKYHVPLGADFLMNIYGNNFGDMNALVKRHVYDALGGFIPVKGGAYSDWEFFTRAMLKGFTLQVIPVPLFWYRQHPGSMSAQVDLGKAYRLHKRVLDIYFDHIPEALRPLILLSRGQFLTLQKMQIKLCEIERQAKEYQYTWSWRITAPLRFIRKIISTSLSALKNIQ